MPTIPEDFQKDWDSPNGSFGELEPSDERVARIGFIAGWHAAENYNAFAIDGYLPVSEAAKRLVAKLDSIPEMRHLADEMRETIEEAEAT